MSGFGLDIGKECEEEEEVELEKIEEGRSGNDKKILELPPENNNIVINARKRVPKTLKAKHVV